MVSRYICSIHDDIDEAVKKGRIDLVAGLTEEARVAGKRMEAKLHEYQSLKYDFGKWKQLKKEIKHLTATKAWIELELGLDDEPDESDEEYFDFDDED